MRAAGAKNLYCLVYVDHIEMEMLLLTLLPGWLAKKKQHGKAYVGLFRPWTSREPIKIVEGKFGAFLEVRGVECCTHRPSST